jgi:hypothetical protein
VGTGKGILILAFVWSSTSFFCGPQEEAGVDTRNETCVGRLSLRPCRLRAGEAHGVPENCTHGFLFSSSPFAISHVVCLLLLKISPVIIAVTGLRLTFRSAGTNVLCSKSLLSSRSFALAFATPSTLDYAFLNKALVTLESIDLATIPALCEPRPNTRPFSLPSTSHLDVLTDDALQFRNCHTSSIS